MNKSRAVLRVSGAREHNLKNIAVEIPHRAITAFVGPSGSGKSSLAFDTIHAEGQRRYFENLSLAARKNLALLPRPDVDLIEGLLPTIGIEQSPPAARFNATVGSLSGIHDYLRVLFVKCARANCPACGKPIDGTSIDEAADDLYKLPAETAVTIVAPERNVPSSRDALVKRALELGFPRVFVDDRVLRAEELGELRADALVGYAVDRIRVRAGTFGRIRDALELAYRLSGGLALAHEVGTGEKRFFSATPQCVACGIVFPRVAPALFNPASPAGACRACGGAGCDRNDGSCCGACRGTGYRNEVFHIGIDGVTLADVDRMSPGAAEEFVGQIGRVVDARTFESVVAPAVRRFALLREIGLDYIALGRRIATLSSGEASRVRLMSALADGLGGVIYVLDEPTQGLHPADVERFVKILRRLRDQGNTLLLADHDRTLVENCDYVVELGPGAGENGGEIMCAGDYELVSGRADSVFFTPVDDAGAARRPIPDAPKIALTGATENNLKGVTAEFPLGAVTAVIGPSGAGKSTLVLDTLYPAVRRKLGGVDRLPGKFENIVVPSSLVRALKADLQSLAVKSPRAMPATLLGVMPQIRELYAKTEKARAMGWTAGRFSSNVKGGRCEACGGLGFVRMSFGIVADYHVRCEACDGRRYHAETLEVKFKGQSVADVLDTSIEAAAKRFEHYPSIAAALGLAVEMGLGYLRLGQAGHTLSGGEAQRIRLVRELGRRGEGCALFVLDEPSRGLSGKETDRLVAVLRRLATAGNCVVTVEHSPEMIAAADWIIELGPGAGDAGGRVIYSGPPSGILQSKTSVTAQYLKPVSRRAAGKGRSKPRSG